MIIVRKEEEAVGSQPACHDCESEGYPDGMPFRCIQSGSSYRFSIIMAVGRPPVSHQLQQQIIRWPLQSDRLEI